MRRKSLTPKPVDPNAPVVPPVPGSGASYPPRPKNLNEAREKLAEKLGVPVASGHGYDTATPPPPNRYSGRHEPREGTWRLFVLSNDPELKIPTEFMGHPVSRRAPPVSTAPWGKAAGKKSV